ncbi:MAG: hypothetical protein ACFFD1_05960, partial [Candidatus Thorarchaeota archaeon]
NNPEVIKLNNMKEIPRFQELCEKYDIIPTYLLSYECANRDEAISILKPIHDRQKCEIGHHLHVWSTPPFQQENKGKDIDLAWIQAYQFELPDSLFEEKAETLKEKIKENYGIYPTSHRAGRFGIDQRSIDWLIKHNFEVDTSIVPLNSFSLHKGKNKGGPDFYNVPVTPYLWKNSLNDSSLNELPISVYYPTNFFKKDFFNYGFGKKIGNQFGNRRLLSLNPAFEVNFNEKIIKSEIKKKRSILNLFLHSSELAIHCSPFTNTDKDYKNVWLILEKTFKFIKINGIKSLPITQASRHLFATRNL